MAVVATVDLPAEAIEFDGATGVAQDTSIRLEQVVPVSDSFVPCLWVASDSVGAVASALRDANAVVSAEVVDRFGTQALVRVEWRQFDDVLHLVRESGGVVLEAAGETGSWRLHLRFPTRDDLGVFYGACHEQGVPVDLVSVSGASPPERAPNSLTDAQREALTLALDWGYFEVPRRTTLSELAAELGVSGSAVSQRLRRGVGAVLAETIRETQPSTE